MTRSDNWLRPLSASARCAHLGAAIVFVCAVCFAASVRPVRAGLNVWSNTGLEGTAVLELAIDPHTPTTLYAGTWTAGLFKSVDGGRTWIAVGVSNSHVSALAIDPLTPTTLYAGWWGEGLYKSTDGGNTWSDPSLVQAGNVYSLVIDPQSPTTLYAGTGNCDGRECGGGVFKSTDGGGTWSSAGLYNRTVSSLAIDPTTPTTLYAADPEWDVFKSTDGGDTWTGTFLNGSPGVLAIDPVRPDTLYAAVHWFPAPSIGCPRGGCRDECLGGGVFKSTGGGATWNTTALTDAYVEALAIDPVSPATLYAAAARSSVCPNAGVFKSTDGGGTWSALNDGLTDLDVTALAIDPIAPSRIYAGTAGGGVFTIEQVDAASDGDGCTVTPRDHNGVTWALLVPLLVLVCVRSALTVKTAGYRRLAADYGGHRARQRWHVGVRGRRR